MALDMNDLHLRVGNAVAHYWATRAMQRERQETAGKADQGLRSAVTGGAADGRVYRPVHGGNHPGRYPGAVRLPEELCGIARLFPARPVEELVKTQMVHVMAAV